MRHENETLKGHDTSKGDIKHETLTWDITLRH